jgi:magnesium chelatase accessory protein
LPLGGPVGPMFGPMAKLLAANTWVPYLFASWASLPLVRRSLLASTGSVIDDTGAALYGQLISHPAHAAGALRLMAQWDLRPMAACLKQLPVPLQLLAGSADRTVPPSHSQRVAALAANAEVVVLPRLGHLAHEEDAPRVCAAVLDAWRVRRQSPATALT